MQKVKIVLKKMRYVHPSKEEYFQSNRPESTDKKTRILTTASRSQSYKTFFLCFKIFAVKLECLLHKENKSIIIKWPSLSAKNEENKFYRIGYSTILRFFSYKQSIFSLASTNNVHSNQWEFLQITNTRWWWQCWFEVGQRRHLTKWVIAFLQFEMMSRHST